MNYSRALLAAYAVVVVLALLVGGTTSQVAFGAYNPAWDGASDLRGEAQAVGAETTIVRNTSTYGTVPARNSVAVVLSPDTGYGDREAARLETFVREGGTLVVAEDYGPHSNDLLADVGADARVDGRPLRDERNHYRSPALPVASNVTNGPAEAGVDSLTLNHGTAVEPNGAEVLVRSSGFAYLDVDRDESLDESEELASYPVVTVESVGAGRVVVVGDPSLLINAMLDRPGNRAFVQWVFTDEEHVLLDYSHAEQLPPLTVARLTLQESPILQLLAGFVGVLAVVAWERGVDRDRLRSEYDRRFRPSRSTGGSVDSESLKAYLKREHPEWEERRIERVVESVLESREDG